MESIHIVNSTESLSVNFKMQEFFHPPLAFANECFEMPKCLLDCVQLLRNVWIAPIRITSTYRPNDSFGFHKTGNAIDFVVSNNMPLEYLNKFKTTCINHATSQLFKDMRKTGVKGFGIENSCIHIDYRPDENCHLQDEYGKFCIFEWSTDKGSTLIY